MGKTEGLQIDGVLPGRMGTELAPEELKGDIFHLRLGRANMNTHTQSADAVLLPTMKGMDMKKLLAHVTVIEAQKPQPLPGNRSLQRGKGSTCSSNDAQNPRERVNPMQHQVSG